MVCLRTIKYFHKCKYAPTPTVGLLWNNENMNAS